MDKPVTISLEAAEILRREFLPRNPNQLRAKPTDVKKAVREFIAAIELARGEGRS